MVRRLPVDDDAGRVVVDAAGVEPEPLDVRRASGNHEQVRAVDGDLLAALADGDADTALSPGEADDIGVVADADALRPETVEERRHQLRVLIRKRRRAVDDARIDAEPVAGLRQFEGAGAGAEHDEVGRFSRHVERGRDVEGLDRVEAVMRLAATAPRRSRSRSSAP